ncbi:ankyrin repeat-containing domain protein [Tuber indicum]|nr:ankyrin repeat-containing domain protein [Tuber indicum]
MSLPDFPNEILLLIAKHLSPGDLNSFLSTNRHLAAVLTPLLHDLAVQDKDGLPALEWAAIEGYEDLVTLVLERKKAECADIDWAKGALHQASAYGHGAIIRKLLNSGVAEVHSRLDGLTALHYASRYGKEVAIRLLFEYGADVNARDGRSNDTALHFAIHGFECVAGGRRMEDELGVWRTFGGGHGVTCSGIQKGFLACVKVLLEKGADARLKDSCGRTALDIARKYKLGDAIGLLEEARLRPNL